MALLKHQEKYAESYKDKELVVHEGGTGKTVCACVWLKDGRDRSALIIVPKRVVKKWQATLGDWGARGKVVSKEQFKKMTIEEIGEPSALVVDEADEFASPLFVKGRSALSRALYELVRAYPDMPVLLLTATPIRSTPWNLHTLLCYRGIYIDWKKWRSQFFSLERRPFLPRPMWLPKKDWRTKIRPFLEEYADIVLLKDCVDELPPVQEATVKVETPPLAVNPEWEPMKAFVAEHRHEQVNKPAEIIRIGKEYRKVLVVAHYVEQVLELEKALSRDRQTFAVYGGAKEQEDILKKAAESDECYLIVQASLGVGFDGDTFSSIVFASMSYKVRDYVQMTYRVRRIHNLHPVRYDFLIGGRCDLRIFETIKKGLDFVPSHWDQNV